MFRSLLSAALFALTASCVEAQPLPARIDLSGAPPSFSEDFSNGLDIENGDERAHRWRPTFRLRRSLSVGAHSLSGNKERQVYVDPAFAGVQDGLTPQGEPVVNYRTPSVPDTRPGPKPLGLNPFSFDKDGALLITADRIEPNPLLWNLPYTSGLITTQGSFKQLYGYFEMSARLPAGKGLWPALWLLPIDGTWPPELDIMEQVGEPRTIYQSTHSKVEKPGGKSFPVKLPFRTDEGFHTYGAAWGPEEVVWYVDGKETARRPTPADMHKPMFLLINLAVGGNWPGEPNAETQFPAKMAVRSVKAWPISAIPRARQ
jgi:hypothetical protein